MIQRFRGHSPIIHPAARLAANATLVGCVTVEAASSIWYGAVLRGDESSIHVGAGSNIQDNAVLHCDADCPALRCASLRSCAVRFSPPQRRYISSSGGATPPKPGRASSAAPVL